jgi:hypothetical protein
MRFFPLLLFAVHAAPAKITDGISKTLILKVAEPADVSTVRSYPGIVKDCLRCPCIASNCVMRYGKDTVQCLVGCANGTVNCTRGCVKYTRGCVNYTGECTEDCCCDCYAECCCETICRDPEQKNRREEYRDKRDKDITESDPRKYTCGNLGVDVCWCVIPCGCCFYCCDDSVLIDQVNYPRDEKHKSNVRARNARNAARVDKAAKMDRGESDEK